MRWVSLLVFLLVLTVGGLLLFSCGSSSGGITPGVESPSESFPRYTLAGRLYKYSQPSGKVKYFVIPGSRVSGKEDFNLPEGSTPVAGATVSIPDIDSTTITDTDGYFQFNDVNIQDLWNTFIAIDDPTNQEDGHEIIPIPPIPDEGGGDIAHIYLLPSSQYVEPGGYAFFYVEAVDSDGWYTYVTSDQIEVQVNGEPTANYQVGWMGTIMVGIPASATEGTTYTVTVSLKSNPSVSDTGTLEVVSFSGGGGGGSEYGYTVSGRIQREGEEDYSWYTIELRDLDNYEWYSSDYVSEDGEFWFYDVKEGDYEVIVYDNEGNYFSSSAGEVEVDDGYYDNYLNVTGDLYDVTVTINTD